MKLLLLRRRRRRRRVEKLIPDELPVRFEPRGPVDANLRALTYLGIFNLPRVNNDDVLLSQVSEHTERGRGDEKVFRRRAEHLLNARKCLRSSFVWGDFFVSSFRFKTLLLVISLKMSTRDSARVITLCY